MAEIVSAEVLAWARDLAEIRRMYARRSPEAERAVSEVADFSLALRRRDLTQAA
jgi:hypothetical protein